VSNSNIKHSKFAALRLKDAVVDYFRRLDGKRPSIDTHNPDLWLNLHIENNRATISIDTSGGSLHRRGYRLKSVEAPMIETLAAAIIRYSDWDYKRPLYDPFCGSGTLLCEAFLRSSGKPPGKLRKNFGLEQLPDFNKTLWNRVKISGDKINVDLPRGIISGSDITKKAVDASRSNCSLIDKTGIIRVFKKDVFDIEGIHDSHIVCNPPYGIRLKASKLLKGFYKEFGDFLKQRCKGSTAFIYFGERQHIKEIGLKPAWKKPLSNGGLDGKLAKYELY
jgi:putative N6-adenine-specific DNA methylase